MMKYLKCLQLKYLQFLYIIKEFVIPTDIYIKTSKLK